MARRVNGIAITEANRFSEFVHPTDAIGLGELRAWLASFTRAGITATMLFTDKGYAVYREGMEAPFDDID